MIERTQFKLREAEFFVAQLARTAEQVVVNDPEIFSFYLSAFLSAARSVTFTLQAEAKAQYDSWFQPWRGRLSPAQQAEMDFLKDQRNASEKQGGVDLDIAWEYVPLSRLPFVHGRHPAYGPCGFVVSGPPGTPEPEVGRRVHSFSNPGASQPVVHSCRQHFELLRKLVADFIDEHRAV